MATFEVRATLPYALRNPDCTPTDERTLMKMAAQAIEHHEAAHEQISAELKKQHTLALNLSDRLRVVQEKLAELKSMVCENEVLRDPSVTGRAREILTLVADLRTE